MQGFSFVPIVILVFGLQIEVRAATNEFHLAIQSDSPLLWYQLAEGTGQAVNFGSLGTSHNAVYNGSVVLQASTLSGDAGVTFDSSDDYLESLGVSTLVGNPAFSIETLIFFPSGGSSNNWGPYLHWGDGGGGDNSPARIGREVYFGAQNANLNRTYAGFYNAGLRTQDTLPLGEWLHIVWTRQAAVSSGAGSVLYVNGLSVPMEQDPDLIPGFLGGGSIDVTATAFRINRGRDFLGTRHFDGTMDEIALYDRVLSPQEIFQHALAMPGLSGLADFDGDGDVDGDDLSQWEGDFGQNGFSDADGDGDSDGADFLAWQRQFTGDLSLPLSVSTAVPEPSSVVLLMGLAAIGILSRPMWFTSRLQSLLSPNATRYREPVWTPN